MNAQLTDQPLQLASREPAFYAIVGTHVERADVRSFAALRERIILRLHKATVVEALTAIQEQTSLRFAYKPSILPASATVSLDARDITVAAALTQVLLDTDVDVEMGPFGQATLVARNRVDRQQLSDTVVVRGTITDSSSHAPLSGAIVRVVGGNQSAFSGPDGTYALSRLSPGTYRLLVRRLGYTARSIEVIATTAGTYTQDVALMAAPTLLDQVVTTVTGSQQLKTIGNTIAVINADSLVPTAPVTDFSDVINARAPGVQVINAGGLTGASPVVYVRGQGSLLQSSQPLLYVDGVRVNNSFATVPSGMGAISGGFNDLIPEDIETINIVKGPSAATLYGTDAANGVILVTTKHGEAGATRWHMYAEGGALTVNPDVFPFNYTGWGHDGSGNIVNSCTLTAMASGSCTRDSVTQFNPNRVPSLTPLGTGNRGEFGLDVSGGSKGVRYFASGDYTSEVGPLKNATFDQRQLDSLLGAFAGSGSIRHPNAASKYDGRVNLTTPLGSDADITLSANYLSQASHIPNTSVVVSAAGGAGYRDACNGWLFCSTPGSWFSTLATDNTQHVTGGATAHWVPAQWLTTRATAGVDASNDAFLQVLPAAAAPVSYIPGGNVYDRRATTTLYSVDLGATARLPITSDFVSSTSVGTQYHRVSVASTVASATQLAVGGTSVGAGIPTGAQIDSESVVAGVYAEEQFALDDRLFLTGAVRVDGANDFGRDFQTAVYPKGGVSWLVSKEPFFPKLSWVTLWRLRGAYGESGTQPGQVLTTLQTKPATIDGTLQPGTTLSTLGNPNVQPERQKELELGTDVDMADNRLHVEFTYYRKRNVNALYNEPLASSIGLTSVEENIGEIVNWGYEGFLSATLITARAFTWDVSLNGSVNHNQVVTLGPYFQPVYGQYGNTSIVAGYPFPSYFAAPYTYSDANHDGIIEPDEVTVSSKQRYVGQAIPALQATAATNFGFFDNHLRIGAQIDYRGGFVLPNGYLSTQCFFGSAAASVLRSASLASQAACQAFSSGASTNRGLILDGSFTRFRELSLTYALPDRLARDMRTRSLSVTLSARNLALWTRYQGGDPEGAPRFLGSTGTPPFAIGGGIATQYWLARINVGL